MPARKRSSAFEDLPGSLPEPAAAPAPIQTLSAAPLPQVERIERLKPSQMLPDRFQPRRLLPPALRAAFFSGQMDCYQAASEWLTIGRSDAGVHAEIERLLAMGSSFEEHGQIKPITGTWASATDGSYVFLIETGERRFWAACLQAVSQSFKEEPLLRVEVVARPTRQRQVLENRHSELPSAVEQACEVAALILAEMDIQPDPSVDDDYDYFRKARSQRMPTGLWDKITPVMQLTRPRMVQLLNILQMTSPLLDLADRYRVPERALREILAAPHEFWEKLLRTAIQEGLTSLDLAEPQVQTTVMSEPAPHREEPRLEPARLAARGLRRFGYVLGQLDEFGQAQALDEVADTLVATGQAEGLLRLLDELSRLISMRMTRR